MTGPAISERIKYDSSHDILYVYCGEPKYGYDDEIHPGIFLRKDDDTDEVIGAIIMGYRKTDKEFLEKLLPRKFFFLNNFH